MDESILRSSPRKKIKMSDTLSLPSSTSDSSGGVPVQLETEEIPVIEKVKQTVHDTQLAKEADVGITEFVSPDLSGFSGILKKRYTDFLVNEILPSGQVVHLDNLKAPKRKNKAKQSIQTQTNTAATFNKPHVTVESLRQTAPNHGEQTKKRLHSEIIEIGLSGELTITTAPVVEPATFRGNNISEPADKIREPLETAALSRDKPSEFTDVREEPSEPGTSQEKQTSDFTDVKGELLEPQDVKPAIEDPVISVANKEDQKPEPTPEQQGKGNAEQDEILPVNALAAWQSYAKEAKEAGNFKLTPDDSTILKSFFNDEIFNSTLALFNRVLDSPHRKSRDYGTVNAGKITDREVRTTIHKEIRRIFTSRLDSSTDEEGNIIITAANARSGWGPQAHDRGGRGNRGRGFERRGGRGGRGDRGNNYNDPNVRQSQPRPLPAPPPGPLPGSKQYWNELGGDYLHFSLYKENKDTMEVVSYLSRLLHIGPRTFAFAGTKDRRAVTVQRLSVYRAKVDDLVWLGRDLRNARLGDYEYLPQGLELGELTGNEFVITLRDCQFPGIPDDGIEGRLQAALKTVEIAAQHLSQKGFINYFGLQRFGTFVTRTDTIGLKMLKGDFEGVIDAILSFSPVSLAAAHGQETTDVLVSSDDKFRALGIDIFKTTGNTQNALNVLPKKFSAESSIIRYLGVHNKSRDYLGAIQTISRNLRLMYVHAYQAFVWNTVASERWKTCGSRVVEGDLVLIKEHKDELDEIQVEQIDADGEVIIQPGANDSAANPEDLFPRARALTKEQAESGEYTIFDIVLPMPGYDILYPAYLENFYKAFMSSEQGGGLDPHDMRRPWKDISLSGSYRKLVVRPRNVITCSVHAYSDENEKFVETDLERLMKKKLEDQGGTKDNAAGKEDIEMADKGAAQLADGGGTKDDGADVENIKIGDEGAAPKEQKLAVVLRMQLSSSQYATMALRELMKGVKTYKPDFGGGR